MISTHGLLTINENGVQTESSLIEALKMLVKELKERKVQFPVVLLSDSHASRKGEKVLAFARENGIRFFFEPSNTSGWLQALDQFNKKFHERYKKAKQRYKKTRQLEAHNPNLDVSLNTSDFLRIIAEQWPHWCEPGDVRRAFELVGIISNGINTSDINKSKFRLEVPQLESQPMNTTIVSPIGVRKGSAEYWKAKCESAEGIIADLMDREVGPVESGVLHVQEKQRKKNITNYKITDMYGSVEMQDLLGKREAVDAARNEEDDKKRQRAEHREAKKSSETAERAELLAKFNACKGTCVCFAPAGKTGRKRKQNRRPTRMRSLNAHASWLATTFATTAAISRSRYAGRLRARPHTRRRAELIFE